MIVFDRFEGEYALVQYRKRIFHIPKSLMPKGAKEGDVLKINIAIDREAANQREEEKNAASVKA